MVGSVATHLKRAGELQLDMPEPFSFALTVAKPAGWHWSTPRELFENGTLWSGLYLDGKPIGLKMSAEKRRVSAVVYAQSRLKEAELDKLGEEVGHGLGKDEDLEGFYEFAAKDELLSTVVQDHYGMRVGRLDDIFGRVILAICLQMAPLARSQKMMARVLEHHGTAISFDGKQVILWPRAGDIARVGPEQLKVSANLGYRAARLVAAASFLTEHPMSLRDLKNLPEDEAFEAVMAIPGVGKYSAGLILGAGSVSIDVWSVVIMSELVLGRTPENPRTEIAGVTAELNRRWGRWAWLAFVYILNDLESLSRTHHLSRIH